MPFGFIPDLVFRFAEIPKSPKTAEVTGIVTGRRLSPE